VSFMARTVQLTLAERSLGMMLQGAGFRVTIIDDHSPNYWSFCQKIEELLQLCLIRCTRIKR